MHILFVLMTFLPSIYVETLKYKINLGSFKFSMIIQLYNFLNSLIIEIFTSIPLFDYQSSKYHLSQIFDFATQQKTRKLKQYELYFFIIFSAAKKK